MNREQARKIRYGIKLGQWWVREGMSRAMARRWAKSILGGGLEARAFLRSTDRGRCAEYQAETVLADESSEVEGAETLGSDG